MLVKYGHCLADSSGGIYNAGDRVMVPCIGIYGVLMNAGYPPKDGRLGEIVLDFEGWAVPIYPELIGARWKQLPF